MGRLGDHEGVLQSLLSTHIAPTVGKLPIGEIDTRILDRLCLWLRDEHHLSPQP